MKLKIKSTGDELVFKLRHYFFRNSTRHTGIFFSTRFNFHFNSYSEYWEKVGAKNALVEVIAKDKLRKVVGVSFEQMLEKAAFSEFGTGPGVIMYNINTVALGRVLARIPGSSSQTLKEDFVFIPALNRNKAVQLLRTIPHTLADCYLMDRGVIVESNSNPEPLPP